MNPVRPSPTSRTLYGYGIFAVKDIPMDMLENYMNFPLPALKWTYVRKYARETRENRSFP